MHPPIDGRRSNVQSPSGASRSADYNEVAHSALGRGHALGRASPHHCSRPPTVGLPLWLLFAGRQLFAPANDPAMLRIGRRQLRDEVAVELGTDQHGGAGSAHEKSEPPSTLTFAPVM